MVSFANWCLRGPSANHMGQCALAKLTRWPLPAKSSRQKQKEQCVSYLSVEFCKNTVLTVSFSESLSPSTRSCCRSLWGHGLFMGCAGEMAQSRPMCGTLCSRQAWQGPGAGRCRALHPEVVAAVGRRSIIAVAVDEVGGEQLSGARSKITTDFSLIARFCVASDVVELPNALADCRTPPHADSCLCVSCTATATLFSPALNVLWVQVIKRAWNVLFHLLVYRGC